MIKSTILKTSFENLSSQWQISKKSSYRVLVIPGHTKVDEVKKEARRVRNQQVEPRYKRMGDADKWVDVWPTAKTFNYSVLPLPVRMGFIEGAENEGIIPSKYANAELMKIPNFLHLTPPHIRNHCQKLKKYCTPWPQRLKEDALMQLSHFDYVRDGPSIKDERSRFVSVTVKISSLHLPKDAKEKFLRLTSRFCVRHEDLLIITSGKCPTKQQNYDYIKFLLSVLYKESLKREEWEGGKEVRDMVKYQWQLNKSYENVLQLLRLVQKEGPAAGVDAGGEESLAGGAEVDSAKEGRERGGDVVEKSVNKGGSVVKEEVVRKYGKSVEKLLNHKESMELVQQYKNNVQSLYSAIVHR